MAVWGPVLQELQCTVRKKRCARHFRDEMHVNGSVGQAGRLATLKSCCGVQAQWL